MTNYTTSDFSEIHGPDEKPTAPGWYIADISDEIIKDCHHGPWAMLEFAIFHYWWDGAFWCIHEYGSRVNEQSFCWFGLKNKP